MEIIYEDNHIIIVNKDSGEIVQGDKTGDTPLSELVKDYIKQKYGKPGQVFLGVVHRLDRPVSGLVVFARTSKALSRLSEMFRQGEVSKTYWALTKERPPRAEGAIESWLLKNERENKSYIVPPPPRVPDDPRPARGASTRPKRAILNYKVIGQSESYNLIEVHLLTGRHHQIRCQLASIGCPIKGDLKYGARRSNPDGSISLLSRRIEFIHPVSKKKITAEAPLPHDPAWQAFRP